MSVELIANDLGLEIRIYNEDYFNSYKSDYIMWNDIARHLSPYLEKEQHRNDDAE